ncbi:MAG: hypothetical protein KDD67_14280 [Ignavibacteriae bacterium]|nr:hypothetical protein [Ignavibacteriota bacterium]
MAIKDETMRFRIPKSLLIISIIGGVALLLALIYYFLLKGEDQTGLGTLGDFLNPLIGIFNILVLGLIAVYLAKQQDEQYSVRRQKEEISNLYLEWMSERMLTARMSADMFLRNHGDGNLQDLYQKHLNKVSDVLAVMAFFHRLEIVRGQGLVADKDVCDVFGYSFAWWYRVCFEQRLPEHWDSHKKLESLYDKIYATVTLSESNKWEQRIKKNLDPKQV